VLGGLFSIVAQLSTLSLRNNDTAFFKSEAADYWVFFWEFRYFFYNFVGC
jgi:hypothetical protein